MSDDGYAFNWHTLDEYDEGSIDEFLKWLVPTVLKDPTRRVPEAGFVEVVREASDGFTSLKLTMQLNGVEVDARSFVEGCYGNMQRFAQAHAVKELLDVVEYADLVGITRQLRNALQELALRIARNLGIDDGIDALEADDDDI